MAESRGWYSPQWHYDNEPETRAALDLIFANHFSRHEPGIFEPLRETLLTHGDHYMHLADLAAYLEADRRLLELYAEPEDWGARRSRSWLAREDSPVIAPLPSTRPRSGMQRRVQFLERNDR